MRLSSTLSLYIGRHFLLYFGALFALFVLLILLFDCIELLRRAAGRPDVTFGMAVELALLKLPHMGQQTFPFAVLFGGMAAFWRLTRNNELVVTRSAGVSVWQFLLPVLVLAFLLGLFRITVLNPFASTLLARFERLENVLLKGSQSSPAMSSSGDIWLRQAGQRGQAVLHASGIFLQSKHVELRNVVVFQYEGTDRFLGRIDAERAYLEDGFWRLTKVRKYQPEKSPRVENEYRLETDLTLTKIQDSFAPPETMSFWDLPGFIDSLRNAGFSAIRHRLYMHSLLAAPFLMAAMVFLAATFTLRHVRRGGTTFIIGCGVLTGFVLYFFSDVVFALGLSGGIPIVLAAWTPSGVTTLLGVAMLLHLEDG
jgi:lipopolysaccharide export system permease protein